MLKLGLAGLAVIEILADGALVPDSSDALRLTSIAGDIVVDWGWLVFLLHLDWLLLRSAVPELTWSLLGALPAISLGFPGALLFVELSLDLLINIFLDKRFGFLVQLLSGLFFDLDWFLNKLRFLENKFVRIVLALMELDLFPIAYHLGSLQVILLENFPTQTLDLDFWFLDKLSLVQSLKVLVITEVDLITLIIEIGQLEIFWEFPE